MEKIESHYGEEYFNDFQIKHGKFGAKANHFLFKDYIKDEHSILDFGCGGGFYLNSLKNKNKTGVEINDIARKFCNKSGVNCVKSLDKVPDSSFDIIISSHCLEHVKSPFEIIKQLYNKLKPNGKIVIVVPTDNYKVKWFPDDINYHMYSFSPMNLGNLLDANSFKKIKTQYIYHKWPPYFLKIKNLFGWSFFYFLSVIWGRLQTNNVQIRAVAEK